MKKVILLTDYYFPHNNANGLCIGRIGKGLLNLGYEVHVIAYSDSSSLLEECIDGIYVHRVKPAFFYKMRSYYFRHSSKIKGKIVWFFALLDRRVRKILFAYWYPFVYPLAAWRYIRKIHLISKNIDCRNIIAGYNPIEAAIACLWFNELSGYHTIAYFMDTFTMTSNARNHPFIFNRGQWWEKKIYDRVGVIGNLAQYVEHFSGSFYQPWKNKMEVMDIPVDFNRLHTTESKDEMVRIVYTGGCSFEDRDPRYFMDLFDKLTKEMTISLFFYGKNNIYEYLDAWNKKNPQVINRGYVNFNDLNKARLQANFMLNFGSKSEIIVPSRILEHISTGKPIIHVFYREDDPCLAILRNYPLVLLIDANAPFETSFMRLRKFVNINKNKVVNQGALEKNFKCYSQDYLAKMCDNYFYAEYEHKDKKETK